MRRFAWQPDWLEWTSRETFAALQEDYMPEMPPLDAGTYLLNYLLEIGPVLAGGMSGAPISFQELDAWCNRTGIALAPWEARAIIGLSREYLSESNKAEKIGAPAPWQPPGAKVQATPQQLAARRLADL